MNFTDNVDLTDPIISRFDLLAVVKDEVDEDYDDALATFVINSHIKHHPTVMKEYGDLQNEGMQEEEKEQRVQGLNDYLNDNLLPNTRMSQDDSDIIPQELLKKYLIHAKRFTHPKLSEID